jgi:hypothetical protein
MKTLFLGLSALAVFAVIRCSPSSVAWTETTNGTGTVTGKLLDSQGKPAVGAKVWLVDSASIPSFTNAVGKRSNVTRGSDTTVLTNQAGNYFIPLPDDGTYNLFGETEKGLKVMIARIKVVEDEWKKSKDSSVKVATAIVTPPGEIRGVSFMPGQDSINQVRVIIAVPGTNFTTIPNIGGVFSFTKMPQGTYTLIFNPTLPDYNVKIMTVNVESGKVTNLDTVILFGKTITGMPQAIAGNDEYGKITAREWDIGATGVYRSTTAADTVVVAPAASMDDFQCIFRATDNDGNRAADTVHVKVLRDAPTVIAGTDTIVSAGDKIRLFGRATDAYGVITAREWDIGGSGSFRSTAAVDTVVAAPAGPIVDYPCIFRATDNDGNRISDTVHVNVLVDTPSVSIAGSGSVPINTPATYKAVVADPSSKISGYRWTIGLSSGGAFSKDSTYSALFRQEGPSIVTLTVLDTRGTTGTATKTVLVTNDAPVISGLSDTSISIKDTIVFFVAARDSNGIRERYYWDFGPHCPPRLDTALSGKCIHRFPDSPMVCTVSVAVEDSFGKLGRRSAVVNVLLDPPKANAGRDTTVRVNANYTIQGSGTDDHGRIVMYRFDTDGDGVFDDSSNVSGVKRFKAPPSYGLFYAVLQVEDDDGNRAADTAVVNVTQQ